MAATHLLEREVGPFWGNTLEGLRSSDGTPLWRYKHTMRSGEAILDAKVVDDKVYVTTGTVGYSDVGSSLIALQLSNGSHLWDYPRTAGSTGLIQATSDVLYLGLHSGSRPQHRNEIVALRTSDRKPLWSYPYQMGYEISSVAVYKVG
jgi:outer membrane protein assembly factor BamB